MSRTIEQREPATIEQPDSITKHLADHALWVCFLNHEGYETFMDAAYKGGAIVPAQGGRLPEDAEISTIQFWHDSTQVTVVPIGYDEEGTLLFQTVEMLLKKGSLPEFTAQSLAKRLKAQPYRNHPKVAISPLFNLPPLGQIETAQAT